MNDWYVVESKTNKTIDHFPAGKFLCRDLETAKERMLALENPVIHKYKNFIQNESDSDDKNIN